MKLTKLSADLAVITKLADSPTETAAELKAKFDQAPRAIGDYLNGTLLPEIEEALALVDEQVQTSIQPQIQALDQAKQPRIGIGTWVPSGGNDGDIYIRY